MRTLLDLRRRHRGHQSAEAVAELNRVIPDGRFAPRDSTDFAGLEPIYPGMVAVTRWRSDEQSQPRPAVENVDPRVASPADGIRYAH